MEDLDHAAGTIRSWKSGLNLGLPFLQMILYIFVSSMR